MAVLFSVLVGVQSSQAMNRGPCDSPRFVNIKPSLGTDVIHRRVKGLIRCAANRWNLDAAETLKIAECESSLWPWSSNGIDRGLFQQDYRYWSTRAKTYLRASWFPQHWSSVRDHGWYKARANTLLSARMMHRNGLGAWSCR